MIKNINDEITIRIQNENFSIQKNCPVYDIILNKLRLFFKKRNIFTFPNNIFKIDFDIYSNILSKGINILENIEDMLSGIKVAIFLKDNLILNDIIQKGIFSFLNNNKKDSSIKIECYILKNIEKENNYDYDTSIFILLINKCIKNIVVKLSNIKNLTNLNLNFLMELPSFEHRLIIKEFIKYNFYSINFEKNTFDLKYFIKNIYQVYEITNDNLFFVLNKEKEFSVNEFKYKVSNGDNLSSINLNIQKDNIVNYSKVDDLNIEINQIQSKSISEKIIGIKILNPQIFNKKPVCLLCKTNLNNKVHFNCFFPHQNNQIFINVDTSILLMSQKKNQQIIIYLEINYTYSTFLYYILSNFNLYYQKNFNNIPKNILFLIFKNNKFPKETLFSLFKWSTSQNDLIIEDDLLKVIKHIKLENITIDSYFDLLLTYGFFIKKYNKVCEILKETLHQKFYLTYNDNIQNFKYDYLLNTEIGKNESENIFDKLLNVSIKNYAKIERIFLKRHKHSSTSNNDTSFSNISYQNNFLTSNQNLITLNNINNLSTNNTSILINSRNNITFKKLYNSQKNSNETKLYRRITENKKVITSYNSSNNSKSKIKNNSAPKYYERRIGVSNKSFNKNNSASSLKSQLEKIKEKLIEEKLKKRYTPNKRKNNIRFIQK